MRILVVAPNRHKLAEFTAALAYTPEVKIVDRVVISISDAHTLAGLQFDAVIGLNTIFSSVAAYITCLMRSPK
jgi:hypothetical protein